MDQPYASQTEVVFTRIVGSPCRLEFIGDWHNAVHHRIEVGADLDQGAWILAEEGFESGLGDFALGVSLLVS